MTNAGRFTVLFRILGAILLVVALAPGGVAGWWYHRNRGWVDQANASPGTIVDLLKTQGNDGPMYKPIFEFTDTGGDTHRATSTWASNPAPYSVGDPVQVLYTPGDPADACIDRFVSLWLGPLIVAGFAVLPTILGLVLLLVVPFAIKRIWPEPAAPA